jgi:hypothetical protein
MTIRSARFWMVCGFHAGLVADVLLVYLGLWRADPTYVPRARIASTLATFVLGPYPAVTGLHFDETFFLFKLITGGVLGAVTGGVLFAGCRIAARRVWGRR